jgi:hypothetical protein
MHEKPDSAQTDGFGTSQAPMLLKNAVFWDVTLCGSCKNRRFGEKYRLHHHGEENQRARER